MKELLVEGRGLSKVYREGKVTVCAVDNIDIAVQRGEILGLVGESGCGKSTLGRLLIALQRPTSGIVTFKGQDLARLSSSALRALRRQMQIVFQDPYSSLNPRMNIREAIAEPLHIHRLAGTKGEEERRIAELLEKVGLDGSAMDRYPHEFSGGQRQRIALARALAVEPEFLICDEVTSSLDVSIRRQIIELLQELHRSLGLTYLFISHDLALVERLADRVMVMHEGRSVEEGDAHTCLNAPQHPYTKSLVASSLAYDIRHVLL